MLLLRLTSNLHQACKSFSNDYNSNVITIIISIRVVPLKYINDFIYFIIIDLDRLCTFLRLYYRLVEKAEPSFKKQTIA